MRLVWLVPDRSTDPYLTAQTTFWMHHLKSKIEKLFLTITKFSETNSVRTMTPMSFASTIEDTVILDSDTDSFEYPSRNKIAIICNRDFGCTKWVHLLGALHFQFWENVAILKSDEFESDFESELAFAVWKIFLCDKNKIFDVFSENFISVPTFSLSIFSKKSFVLHFQHYACGDWRKQTSKSFPWE